jgi:hypothetical protein
MKKKLFLLELNEFNLKFINSNIKKGKFTYIKKILSFKYYKYRCDQREEINGLDPWTQWVNIHTGRRSTEHKLMQIGESKNLKFKQIWDYLSKKNILSGVWGVMNAKNYNSKNNKIFFPDPWNFTEEITPVKLKMFFNFPSYLLKNYLDLSFFISLKKFIFFSGRWHKCFVSKIMIINLIHDPIPIWGGMNSYSRNILRCMSRN